MSGKHFFVYIYELIRKTLYSTVLAFNYKRRVGIVKK